MQDFPKIDFNALILDSGALILDSGALILDSGGGGPNITPSFICLDTVEDFILFILIARCPCSH